MPKTREEKEQIVENLINKLTKVKSVIFVNFKGLATKELELLRHKLEKEGIDFLVTKKSLLKVAFVRSGFSNFNIRNLKESIATIFNYNDEIMVAKILEDFIKSHKALKVAGGILERYFVKAEVIKNLAKLPSKSDLLGQVTRVLEAPLVGLMNIFLANLKGLIGVLHNLKPKT